MPDGGALNIVRNILIVIRYALLPWGKNFAPRTRSLRHIPAQSTMLRKR
jgi:hypothetical protein